MTTILEHWNIKMKEETIKKTIKPCNFYVLKCRLGTVTTETVECSSVIFG